MIRRRKIVPRKRTRKGKVLHYVRTPVDLHHKNMVHEQFFHDPTEAERRAKALTEARYGRGDEFLKLSEPDQSELCHYLRAHGMSGIRAGVKMLNEHTPKSQLGIAQVAADCLKEAKESGLRHNSLATLKCSLNSFANFCDKSIGNVTGTDIKAWMDSHPEWTNKTKRGRIVDVSTMFKFAKRQKMVSENPCDDVKRPKVDQKDHMIFHVSEVRVLLETIQTHDVALLGYLCPDLFGGLRPTESSRIKAKNVSAGRIKLDATQTKKRWSRTVHFCRALKAFLAVPGVQFEHTNLVKRMRKIRLLAGDALSKLRGKKMKFPWAQDIVRHTFCSNAVHEFGFAETAKLACTSEENLRTTYFTAIEHMSEVKEFWALRPLKIKRKGK